MEFIDNYSFIFQRESYSELTKGWIMIQYDNRPLSEIDSLFCKKNKEYCQKLGYTYRFISEKSDYPPYWTKVKLAYDILKNENYSGVMWIDTDALVVKDKPIEDFFNGEHEMVFSPDAPIWALQSPFNAGIWMVKKEGLSILEKWWSKYNPENWVFDGSKWHSNGIWAGDTYEQGAFSSYVLPDVKSRVLSLDWSILQDVKPTENSYTLHFSDNQKSLRQTFIDTHFKL